MLGHIYEWHTKEVKADADKPAAGETAATETLAGKARYRRADAIRNHEHLLRSAARTFVNEGPRVTMHTVARNAGVGIGTLYRHFPDRTVLLAALRTKAYELVLGLARSSRAANADPLAAIRAFLFGIIDHRDAIVLPFTGAPVALTGADAEARQAISEELGHVLEAGRRAGVIRADVNALDVMIASAHLARPLPNLPEESKAARRQAQIFVDGLRPTPESIIEGELTLVALELAWSVTK